MRTFLENHVQQLVAIDFLVVPTVSFRLLFVFVVLGHHRRHAMHFNVTAHPTAEWTGRQIAEAFPWDSAPSYLLHRGCAIAGRRAASSLRAKSRLSSRLRELLLSQFTTEAHEVSGSLTAAIVSRRFGFRLRKVCSDNQEERPGALNPLRSQFICSIRVFGNDSTVQLNLTKNCVCISHCGLKCRT